MKNQNAIINKFYDIAYLEEIQQFLVRTKERSYQLLDPQSGNSIADIGCGAGQDIVNIARSGAKVFGIDHDPQMISKAKQQPTANLDIEFICCAADTIPLKSNSIDKIRFDRIFQHIADHDGVLKEASRLLKSGGYLQIVDADYLSLSLFLEDPVFEHKIINAVAYRHIPNGHKVRCLPLELEHHGFKLISIEVHNYIVTDFEFANYMISFDKLINQELKKGNITSLEYEMWQRHKNRTKEQFNLSINFMLMIGQKLK